MEIVLLIIGVIAGFVFGYLWLSRKTTELKANVSFQGKQIDDAKAATDEANRSISALRDENDRLKEAKTKAEAQVDAAKERLEELAKTKEEQHKQIKEEFQNLATQILKENASEFKDMSTISIKNLVDPLTDRIKEFREKVENCYGNEAMERRSLKDEVKRLVEQNQKIGEDAVNLTHALKNDSKTQGNWGEMILGDILQSSGLKEGEQYFPQDTMRDENGNIIKSEKERDMRPDMVVMYPGNRKIIIDSKVSLTAYVDYVNAQDKDTENKKLKEHITSIRNHIKELSEKDYSKYKDDAPEFVMMFIPNEAAYYAALKEDSSLWDFAYQKKIVLMNQTNLITSLRLALDLWRRDAQEKNIMEIVKLGSDLYDKFASFTDNFNKIGSEIKKTQEIYDSALGQLSTGKGNLISKAEKLKGLGITPKKQLSITSDEDD